MKKILKYAVMFVILAGSLCSCAKLWEEEWVEVRKRPEIEGGITPLPWDQAEDEERPVGN